MAHDCTYADTLCAHAAGAQYQACAKAAAAAAAAAAVPFASSSPAAATKRGTAQRARTSRLQFPAGCYRQHARVSPVSAHERHSFIQDPVSCITLLPARQCNA